VKSNKILSALPKEVARVTRLGSESKVGLHRAAKGCRLPLTNSINRITLYLTLQAARRLLSAEYIDLADL